MAISILQWNACSLCNKFRELKQLLATQNYEIICIQETYFKPHQTAKWEIPGYNLIRHDRPPPIKGGGVAIYIRSHLKYREVTTPTTIETQAVEIETEAGLLTVANVYLPPQQPFDDDIIKAIKTLLTLPKAVIVGDFNAKHNLWNSPVTDAKGKALADIITDSDFVVLNQHQPTRTDSRGNTSHIDLSLASNNVALKCTWATKNSTMASDHHPILIKINSIARRKSNDIRRWVTKAGDWTTFKQECEKLVTLEAVYNDNVDKFNEQFTDSVLAAAKASVPLTSGRPNNRPNPLPYWSEEIKAALTARNRARNKMARSKNLDDCIEYRRLRAQAQKCIRQAAIKHWRDFCATLTDRTRLSVVWKKAKQMQGYTGSSRAETLIDGDKIITADKEKAEAFAKQYAAVSSSANYNPAFLLHKTDIEQNHSDLFENNAPDSILNTQLNREFTRRELDVAITKIRKGKAPGPDQIAPDFLVHLPDTARTTLLKLYNHIWKESHIPTQWKTGIIVPILKNGKDKKLAASYRPITLTSAVCKLMERMIANRLNWFLEKENLLSNCQSGFRQRRSTIDPIMRLQDTIVRQFGNKDKVLSVYVDFEKAYDMVWKNGLMIKLKKLGINGHMYDWVADFLDGRTARVRLGNTLSDPFELENGTPQGAMISPSAFISMMDDLPTAINDTEPKGKIDVSLFADDTALHNKGPNTKLLFTQMQRAIDALLGWCDQWGFSISTEKTVAVLYTKGEPRNAKDLNLTLKGKPLKTAETLKLGQISWTHFRQTSLVERAHQLCHR